MDLANYSALTLELDVFFLSVRRGHFAHHVSFYPNGSTLSRVKQEVIDALPLDLFYYGFSHEYIISYLTSDALTITQEGGVGMLSES